MKILVTGGAGYIGSHLVSYLLDAGHKVAVLDNFRGQQNTLAHLCSNPDLSITCGDARSEEHLAPLVNGVDVIIPLAGLVGAPLCQRSPVSAKDTNTHQILLLTRLMAKEQRLIFPATNSGYGRSEHPCSEEMEQKPLSHYAKTKVAGENIALCRPNMVSLRFATLFGMSPAMRTDLMVNDFVYRALRDRALTLFEADYRRPLLHVRDAARVILHTIDNFEAMRGRPFNVACENVTKRQLCERIGKHLPEFAWNVTEIASDVDQRDYAVDTRRIEATGFVCKHDLDSGIAELIRGYQGLRNWRFGNA